MADVARPRYCIDKVDESTVHATHAHRGEHIHGRKFLCRCWRWMRKCPERAKNLAMLALHERAGWTPSMCGLVRGSGAKLAASRLDATRQELAGTEIGQYMTHEDAYGAISLDALLTLQDRLAKLQTFLPEGETADLQELIDEVGVEVERVGERL